MLFLAFVDVAFSSLLRLRFSAVCSCSGQINQNAITWWKIHISSETRTVLLSFISQGHFRTAALEVHRPHCRVFLVKQARLHSFIHLTIYFTHRLTQAYSCMTESFVPISFAGLAKVLLHVYTRYTHVPFHCVVKTKLLKQFVVRTDKSQFKKQHLFAGVLVKILAVPPGSRNQ